MSGDKLQSKKNIIFYQIIGIGVFFFALFFIMGAGLYPKLILIGKILLNKLEVVCGCADHLSFASHPFIFTSLILIGLILATFFGFALIKILKIKFSTGKFIKTALKNKKLNISPKLKTAALAANIKNKIIEIDEKEPLIFCFNFRHPEICVSSRLVKELNKTELTAVLLHEKYHLLTFEPIKLFLIKTATAILFFLPIVKLLAEQFLTFAEIAADEQATNNWQNKTPLTQALVKIIKIREHSTLKNNLALSFFTATGERINKLIDDRYVPQFKFFTSKFLLSIFLLFFSIAFLGSLVYYGKSVMVYEVNRNSCPLMSFDSTTECRMSIEKAECVMNYNLGANFCE